MYMADNHLNCRKFVSVITIRKGSSHITDRELQLLPSVLLNLYQVTEFVKYLPEDGGDGGLGDCGANVIPTALSRVFMSVAAYVKSNPEKASKVCLSL